MTRLLHAILFVLLAGLLTAPSAFAQRPPFQNRAFVIVNGSYQMGGNDFERVATLRANAEDGSFTTDYDVKGGPAFDVTGSVRLRRRIGVGVGVTRFSRSTPSALNGSVPHPFFFNRPRTVLSDVAGLDREELAVHAQVQAIAPIGRRLQIMAFGGPSFFHVKQGMVSTFTWTDAYPFDSAAFGTATTVKATGSKVGFNAGADLAYFFSRQIGVGGTIQFSRATVGVDVAGATQDVKAGGARAGGGLRLRF